jgi:hypothetical protein
MGFQVQKRKGNLWCDIMHMFYPDFDLFPRHLKISLPSNSTIADLSNEIAMTLKVDKELELFTLEEFELRMQEYVSLSLFLPKLSSELLAV